MPFNFSDFLAAALDYLGQHPLAFGLVVTAALILAYECWLHAVKDAALRRVLRDASIREGVIKQDAKAFEQCRQELLEVISRNHGVDNPNRFR